MGGMAVAGIAIIGLRTLFKKKDFTSTIVVVVRLANSRIIGNIIGSAKSQTQALHTVAASKIRHPGAAPSTAGLALRKKIRGMSTISSSHIVSVVC